MSGRSARTVAVILLATTLITACAPASSSAPGSAGPGSSSGPGASPGPSLASIGALASRTMPGSATAPIDDGAWGLADRLAAPSYTPDTTAALVEGLARSGIGTYADTSSTTPEVALSGPASPFRMLDFQVHAMAVGVWTGATFSGSELDGVLPLPTGSVGQPTTAQLLAAYVAAADSPGGALSRALMAGQDLLAPATLRFPAVVLVLFASDIATDGGRLLAPGASASPATGSVGAHSIVLAGYHAADRSPAVGPAASTGVCTDTANWIQGTIDSLFSALKVATPDNLPGAIVASIWNWLVSKAQAFVQGLISSVTGAVLGTIRSIAGTIAAVAEQIASLLPYGLRVTAAPASGGGATFTLGPDPQPGSFKATISAGDLPSWPPILTDCAAAANIALADLHSKNIPLTWGPLQAAPDPLLTPDSTAKTEDVTDANGDASWGFVVSSDPGDPKGEQQNQVDAMPVTVHRPEVEAARQHLTQALLGSIPGILQPFVAAIFAPYISGLQARLNALLDVRGTGSAILIFHERVKPTPGPSVTPAPSASCHPNPVVPGTYTGTITNTSSETIDLGVSGGLVATTSGSGKATMTVAADGSVTGSWDLAQHLASDEIAKVDGSIHMEDKRAADFTYTAGTMFGTACALMLTFGNYTQVTCKSSLVGDCMNEPPPPHANATLSGLGAPSSVAGGHVVWTYTYASSTGAIVKDLLTIDVMRSGS